MISGFMSAETWDQYFYNEVLSVIILEKPKILHREGLERHKESQIPIQPDNQRRKETIWGLADCLQRKESRHCPSTWPETRLQDLLPKTGRLIDVNVILRSSKYKLAPIINIKSWWNGYDDNLVWTIQYGKIILLLWPTHKNSSPFASWHQMSWPDGSTHLVLIYLIKVIWLISSLKISKRNSTRCSTLLVQSHLSTGRASQRTAMTCPYCWNLSGRSVPSWGNNNKNLSLQNVMLLLFSQKVEVTRYGRRSEGRQVEEAAKPGFEDHPTKIQEDWRRKNWASWEHRFSEEISKGNWRAF